MICPITSWAPTLSGVVLKTGLGVHNVEARRRSRRALPQQSNSKGLMATTTRCSIPSNGSGVLRPTSAASPNVALVKSNQLMPKPDHLTWEEAASPGLVNSTAYRQLVSRNGAGMKQGDNVLIWGASGGLGGFATQYALNGGATPDVCGLQRRQGRASAGRWARS
jgi:crotonyl-CoA reductase